MEQGTPEWFAARIGKVTASRVSDVIGRTKSGYGAQRGNYAAQIICERLTGVAAESFTNTAMQWGTDHEPEARGMYEFATDLDVEEVGFVSHPTIAMAGASPDGLVGADGLVEIKAPNTATHLDTLRGQKIPAKYEVQMLWQMACTGRQFCDFVSYDPRLPHHLRLFVKRLPRDDARIAELESEVRAFLTEIEATIDDLSRLYGAPNVQHAA